MIRVRFEPIDVEDIEAFEKEYKKLRKMINGTFSDKFLELIPDIRKMYAVDEHGLPIDPNIDNS